MVSLKKEAVEERLTNAVKYVHTLRGVGQKVVASNVTRLFHINNAYTPIFTEITGKEPDIQGLCDEALKMARAINYKKKHPEVESETAPKGCNPTTENLPQEEKIDIDRLRDRIRQEIYDEVDNRDKEYAKSRRYNVAFGVLTSLIPHRHKDRPDEIAKRVVRIADEFLEELNKTE